ncbi:MAG: hypothetical protein DMF95_25880 [Acidobacteria bacterium]|nr:MAG: hypothetical protein DMF96_20995 [Acidobacteriota bacterium]PYR19368.1 MAG: hypothetical protein DMF94_16440 [Acidobacteriota bacterium]PYR43418.1 MAG: hypothetical protein DMF95_25880 [Acidobacteriota bacterium]
MKYFFGPTPGPTPRPGSTKSSNAFAAPFASRGVTARTISADSPILVDDRGLDRAVRVATPARPRRAVDGAAGRRWGHRMASAAMHGAART